jgi:hypothetical protein
MWITVYQVMHVLSALVLDVIEIRMTLARLNPPRLLISQSVQYVAMFCAAFFHAFARSYGRARNIDSGERLPPISAATLTMLDISCDASSKIAFLLSPRYRIEAFLGILPLAQTIVSYFTFSAPMIAVQLLGTTIQTFGFMIVCSDVIGKPFEPVEQEHWKVLGMESETAGYLFAAASLILRCLNLTMTQALSTSIHLTAASFCRGTGVWGFLLTSIYHFVIYRTGRERLVIFNYLNQLPILTVLFIAVAAAKHYTCFWLVLKTSALEYSLVVMFGNVAMFIVRRMMFREDGATFGYAQFPVMGMATTIIGLAMMSIQPAKDEQVGDLIEPTTDDFSETPKSV